MKIYTDLSKYNSSKKAFITIGTFDGIHIGHQKVLKNLIKQARKKEAISVLLTFFPHPRMVLQKDADIKLLNTIDERIALLEKSGLDVLIIHEFTKEFAKHSALNFVRDILVAKLNLSNLVIGYDHHFGKNREGNFEQLKELGFTYGFKVKKISKKDINSIAVSSTKVRTALKKGNIKKVNSYLGYPFMLSGEVVKGKNLGEKIGFPTANIEIKESYKILPKTGAYFVKSNLNNVLVYGMMNIGYRPTINGKHKTIEIHFLNFENDLYGSNIQIDLLAFLREEIKFESIDALKNQLVLDKEKSLELITRISKNK